MSYTAPTVVASGISFATLQSDGAAGHLEALITANLAATSAPSSAPTLSETGSGGTLPAATYYAVVTESNGFGETTASPASTGQAITLGQNLVVTFPSLQTGNTSRNTYIGTASAGPFTLAASGTTASSVTISAPLPTNSYAAAPPTFNTTGLTYTDANKNIHNRRLELLRSCKDGNLHTVYDFLRQVVADFNRGNPMTFASTVSRLRDAHAVFAILNTLCSEAGTLIDANAGTIGNSTNGITNATTKRTWP
jgi:hypothetical protein